MSSRDYQMVELPESKISPSHNRQRFTEYCVWGFCIIVITLISGLVCWLFYVASPENNIYCHIEQSSTVRLYPDSIKRTYIISFNQTIMQAKYVAYIQPSSPNSCKSCKYFRKDPYDINVLRDDDYIGTAYDRGHLVPNVDYGNDTYIISNVVPQIPKFNQQIWRQSEEMIRSTYKGKLILKGCDYSDKYVMTKRNNKLYIPLGCWYVVVDSNDMNQIFKLKILDYGYFENKNTSVFIKRLPDWIVCQQETK